MDFVGTGAQGTQVGLGFSGALGGVAECRPAAQVGNFWKSSQSMAVLPLQQVQPLLQSWKKGGPTWCLQLPSGLSFGSKSWAQPKFWHFTLPSAHLRFASASSAFFFASSMIRCLADPICGDGPLTMSNSALGCIHCSTTSSSPSVSPSSSKWTPSLASGVSACLPL